MDVTTISVMVALIGCFVGVMGWLRNASKDDSDIASNIAAIKVTQEHAADDIKDIKAEFRSIKNDVNDAKATAHEALNSANAAHERLDAMNIENASDSRDKLRRAKHDQ